MRFSPLSFLLGLAAASLVPVLTRVMRPLAVEATAAGLGVLEDTRRILAEQVETFEDIVAEARARREQLDGEAMAASTEDVAAPEPASEVEAPGTAGRPRRRANGAARRRA